MNPTHTEEKASALFAELVLQHTNMAMMFMGRVPHPESGQPVRELNAARMFIDMLEMLELKTKGNLSKEEEQLLRQSLMSLRMTFVEEVDKAGGNEPPPAAASSPEPARLEKAAEAAAEEPAAQADDDSKKKFVKKY